MLIFSLCLPSITRAQESAIGNDARPNFEIIQSDLFGGGRSLTNAIADFDNDGDLDLFVGFNGQPNRLYRNDEGVFVDVAERVGLADVNVTRTAAWGDYNADGHVDLFVAFVSREGSSNKLYRNDGDGVSFTDVTVEANLSIQGSFRQASWIDYDSDGDVDLYIGLRDTSNVLFENHDGTFKDVASERGVDDARRTVGAAWLDYDKDGDLDLVVANMDGDANGLFRNDGNTFIDVASAAGIAAGGRGLGDAAHGTVRATVVDFDNDGHLDVFMANYGPNGLFRNKGDGTFENVAPEMGLAEDNRYDTSTWGDYDNDGYPDVYVNGTITGGTSYLDYLYRNLGNGFVEVTPKLIEAQKADHGAHFFDADMDGDLDLALTGAAEDGMHYILGNRLDATRGGGSLLVSVLDDSGRHLLPGSEVRLYQSDTGKLLGTRVLDTGSGYNSQNAMPVHFGLGGVHLVDVLVTTMSKSGRRSSYERGINRKEYSGRSLVLYVDESGQISLH